MNEMIPVIQDRDGRPKVAGIDLHRALQCNTPYRKWFPRMCEYGFTEGIDYTTADKIVRRAADGVAMPQVQHVHLLSLGMAKEICLLQRTEIGKKCRQYVLGIEKAWHDFLAVHARAAELERARHRQIDEQNKLLLCELSRQENKIRVLQPKADYFDTVLSCQDAIPITVIAKDFGWSAVRMNKFLHARKIQFKRNGTWTLYAQYAQKGYTRTETVLYHDSYGNEHVSISMKWTQKGRAFIYQKMAQAGYAPKIPFFASDEKESVRTEGGTAHNV